MEKYCFSKDGTNGTQKEQLSSSTSPLPSEGEVGESEAQSDTSTPAMGGHATVKPKIDGDGLDRGKSITGSGDQLHTDEGTKPPEVSMK